MGSDNSILPESDQICGSARVRLKLIFFVESQVWAGLTSNVSGSGRFFDEFWFFHVGFGLKRFFKRKSWLFFKKTIYFSINIFKFMQRKIKSYERHNYRLLPRNCVTIWINFISLQVLVWIYDIRVIFGLKCVEFRSGLGLLNFFSSALSWP